MSDNNINSEGSKPDNISNISLVEEMQKSYLDYAMSVIVSRALPDVRDGLKPVHRRVLYGMHELGIRATTAYKKSARIVGEVLGKYHPHGDTSVYDTMVRMAQEWSLRYLLVDGQGNFGSMDGDGPAAQRYTEVRIARISQELLSDLEKETVNFVENYDGTEMMPEVLPTKIPNMLVNGSSGIAVGMATNMPPHNISEVVAVVKHILHNRRPKPTLDELVSLLPGPDFPTGGIIIDDGTLRDAYETGRGTFRIRARVEIEPISARRQAIVVLSLIHI